ncbi:MAG: c-type cytochrome biogenesis protein CcsB [Acidobacteria bacterium]|nr:c-type cytochrome biogenesis protein CcsB [Acidobacteriota bacterium]
MIDPALARLSDNLFWIALVAYSVAMVLLFAGLAYRARLAGSAGTAVAALGAGAHALSIAARGLAAARAPWGNMYEYSSMVGFLVVAGYLFSVDRRLGLREIGGFAMGAAVLALAAARLLYAPAGPLVPALGSYWLKIHVVAAIVGSSLFALSFIFTALYLFKDRAGGRAPAALTGSTVGAAWSGATAGVEEGFPRDHLDDEEARGAAGPAGGRPDRFPSAAALDSLAHRTVAFAFPVWTFAVIAGAIWAHEAWGRYWGWDPKETWAFITWVIYAGYLHARATAGWRGRRAAVVAAIGFASLLVTYYAVNLWIVGLHSYAR